MPEKDRLRRAMPPPDASPEASKSGWTAPSPAARKAGQPPSPLLCLQHEKLVDAGLGAPDFALAARELPHPGVAIGQRKVRDFFGLAIKAQDRIRAPVADPHGLALVHIDGVRVRRFTRKMPVGPAPGLAVVAE